MSKGYYKWKVEIAVHPRWVADGFNLTEERLDSILERVFDHAYEHEFEGRVLKAPDPEQIRAEQGYKVEGRKPRLCVRCEQYPCDCGADHECGSVTTADGHGAFCRICGETLA
jgi:hypothetical protein